MSNRFEDIRKVVEKVTSARGIEAVLPRLCDPVAEHVESILGNYLGVRSWVPKSEASISITETSRPIGCEITSKKGEIAEVPFECEIEDTTFLPFGLKLSITNSQIQKAKTEDAKVDLLERFMSSMAVGMQTAESLVFFKHVVDQFLLVKKPIVNNGNLEVKSLLKLVQNVEQEGWLVEQMVMSANTFADVRCFGKDFFDEATTREIETCGLYGHLWTADLRVLPVHKQFPYVLALGEKGEKVAFLEGEDRGYGFNTIVDRENSIIRNSVEHVPPTEPVRVTYNFVPQSDPARSRHVFEARSSIGVRVNNLAGIAVIEMIER